MQRADIGKLRPLQLVPPEDIARLETHTERVRFGLGEVVVHPGTPADRAWLLIAGRLAVTLDTAKGPRQLGEIWPGEVCGESALFRDAPPHRVRVAASSPSECLVVTPALLEAARGTRALASVQVHLMGALARRIRATNLMMRKVWQESRAAASPRAPAPAAPRSLFDRLAEYFGG